MVSDWGEIEMESLEMSRKGDRQESEIPDPRRAMYNMQNSGQHWTKSIL